MSNPIPITIEKLEASIHVEHFHSFLTMTAKKFSWRQLFEHFQFRWLKSGFFIQTSFGEERIDRHSVYFRSEDGHLTFVFNDSILEFPQALGIVTDQGDGSWKVILHCNATKANHDLKVTVFQGCKPIDCPKGSYFMNNPALPMLKWVISEKTFGQYSKIGPL